MQSPRHVRRSIRLALTAAACCLSCAAALADQPAAERPEEAAPIVDRIERAIPAAAPGALAATMPPTRCGHASRGVSFDARDGFQWNAREQAAVLLDMINEMRCQAGVGPLARDARIDDAAERHARYQVVHDVTTHAQQASRVGYWGARPTDRMRASGYPVAGSGEVVARSHPLAVEAFSALSLSIRHRIVMLGSRFSHAGVGVARDPVGRAVAVVNLGVPLGDAAPAARARRLVVYPSPDQESVPTTYAPALSASEPDAARALQGYPISVQTDEGARLQVGRFEIRDAQTGEALPSSLHVAPDPRPAPGDTVDATHPGGHAAFLVPDRRLGADRIYEARFEGAIEGRPVVRTWRFRTDAEAPLAVAEAADIAAGEHVRVRLAGCTGQLRWSRSANLQASVWSTGWMQVRGMAPGPGRLNVQDACGRSQTVAIRVL